MKKVFAEQLENGQCYEGEINISSQNVYIVKHTINYIPVAYEYYYVINDYSSSSMVVVRAPKKWGDNFDKNTGESIKKIIEKGKVKKCSYDVRKGMEELRTRWELDTYGVEFDSAHYVDFLQTSNSIWEIVLGIGILLLMACFVVNYVITGHLSFKNLLTKVAIVLFFFDCCLALHIINLL